MSNGRVCSGPAGAGRGSSDPMGVCGNAGGPAAADRGLVGVGRGSAAPIG